MTTTINASTSSGLISSADTSGILQLQTANTAAVTIDASQNVGVGTASPNAKLSVQGGNFALQSTTTSGSTSVGYLSGYSDKSGSNYEIGRIDFQTGNFADAGQIAFSTKVGAGSLTQAMLLNSSGNLGLGVTPSAWTSVFKAFQVGAKSSLSYYNGNTYLSSNFYNDGTSAKYITTDYASQYNQTSGQHQWFNAPSGTAGNAITFTQAMTLDASGYLLLGTTASQQRFMLAGNQRFYNPSAESNVNTVIGQIDGQTRDYSRPGILTSNFAAIQIATDPSTWYKGDLRFLTNGADGTSTTATERMRIDSSGALWIGGAFGTSVASGAAFTSTTAATTLYIGHANGSASGSVYEEFRYNTNTIGSITQSGTTAVLYNVTSDQRLKENIADADSASSLIDSLQVRKFDWKTDQTHQRYGFIAQELVTVAPEAVHQPTDPEEMMAVDYSKLVPMLVKEIQSLRQRLSAANL
jgi:hypothetical protein